jgi:hypothetical protein
MVAAHMTMSIVQRWMGSCAGRDERRRGRAKPTSEIDAVRLASAWQIVGPAEASQGVLP